MTTPATLSPNARQSRNVRTSNRLAISPNLGHVPRRPAYETPNPSGPDLRQLREGAGREGVPYTLQDIERMGGPTFSYLSKVERGEHTMGERLLRRYAAVLGVHHEAVRMSYSVTMETARREKRGAFAAGVAGKKRRRT